VQGALCRADPLGRWVCPVCTRCVHVPHIVRPPCRHMHVRLRATSPWRAWRSDSCKPGKPQHPRQQRQQQQPQPHFHPLAAGEREERRRSLPPRQPPAALPHSDPSVHSACTYEWLRAVFFASSGGGGRLCLGQAPTGAVNAGVDGLHADGAVALCVWEGGMLARVKRKGEAIQTPGNP